MTNLTIQQACERIEMLDLSAEAIKKERAELIDFLIKSNDEAISKLDKNEYGLGTVNFEDSGYEFKATVSKSVKWDENELRVIRGEIRNADKNPDDYINVSYKVSETDYKGWTDAIKKRFEKARTVKPSAVKLTFKKKGE